MLRKIMLFIFSVNLFACAPSIVSKVDPNSVNFEVGKTSKADVINTLGLPEHIVRASDGNEKLIYPGASKLTGFVGGGPKTGVHGAPPGLLDTAVNKSMVEDGAVYEFDKNGILISENSPRTRNTN